MNLSLIESSVANVTPARPRKRRGRGAARRAEILAAAQRVFLTEGFECATMRRIAAEIGLTATALYDYFDDKDAILRAIAEATFTDMLAALEAAQAGAGTSLERFRACLLAYVDFGLARPDEYRLTFLAKVIGAATPGRQAVPCGQTEAAERSFAIVQSGIRCLIQDGVFAPADDILTAEAVWACLHGTTALLIDLRQHVRSPPERVTATVIDTVIAGFCATTIESRRAA